LTVSIGRILSQAYQRDCARVNILTGLSQYLEDPGDDDRDAEDPTPYVLRTNAAAFTRFADAVYDAGVEFVDAIDDIIERSPLKRLHPTEHLCGRCGDPYCTAYVQMAPTHVNVTIIELPDPGK